MFVKTQVGKGVSEKDLKSPIRTMLKNFNDYFKGIAKHYEGILVGIAKSTKENVVNIVTNNSILELDLSTQLVHNKQPIVK